jgi:hypothetical protein
MLQMPKYFTSKFFDKDKNKLDQNAPQELKDEWAEYNGKILKSQNKEEFRIY